MKCCDVTAKDLRSLIVIERETVTPDGQGGNTSVWAEDPSGGVWAKWKAVSGRDAYQAMRDAPLINVKATIRFRGDGNDAPYYSPADRVVYRGRYYAIQAVRDPDDRQKWLELDLVETSES